MAFAVQRSYGKFGKDYLHAWCNDWGTACMGSVKMALKFGTKQEADLAAARAQVECKDADGNSATGCTFTAVAI